MPGPWSRTWMTSPSPVTRRVHADRRARRRVLGGVLEQVRERRRRQPRIEPHRHVRVDAARRTLMPLQRRAPPGRAPPRRSPTDAPSATRRRSRRHRCAPSRGCSGTAASGARPRPGSGRSARARSSAVSHEALMLLAATRMAVSGVRRSWPSDASSAVFSSSLWRVSSAALRSSRNCARSIAMATTPPSVSSVPGSIGPAGGGQQADRAWCRRAAGRAGSSCRRPPSSRWPA